MNPQPTNLFTSERGKELVKKSIEARMRNAARLKEAESINSRLSVIVEAQTTTATAFMAKALARTREEMESLFDQLTKCKDPKDKQALSVALKNLEGIEQKLSMRNAPASVKPEKSRKSSHTAPVEPDEPA